MEFQIKRSEKKKTKKFKLSLIKFFLQADFLLQNKKTKKRRRKEKYVLSILKFSLFNQTKFRKRTLSSLPFSSSLLFSSFFLFSSLLFSSSFH